MNPAMMQMLLKSLGINVPEVEGQIKVFAENASKACAAMTRIEEKLDLILAKEGIIYGTSIEQPKQLTNGKSN